MGKGRGPSLGWGLLAAEVGEGQAGRGPGSSLPSDLPFKSQTSSTLTSKITSLCLSFLVCMMR